MIIYTCNKVEIGLGQCTYPGQMGHFTPGHTGAYGQAQKIWFIILFNVSISYVDNAGDCSIREYGSIRLSLWITGSKPMGQHL